MYQAQAKMNADVDAWLLEQFGDEETLRCLAHRFELEYHPINLDEMTGKFSQMIRLKWKGEV